MRVILILSLLPIAVASARADDPSAQAPRPAITTASVQPTAPPAAAVTASAPAPVVATAGTPIAAPTIALVATPVPTPVAVLPQADETPPTASPAASSVSMPTTSGSQATEAASAAAAPERTTVPEVGHHKRVAMEEHFAQANVTHDGHLTLDEAKSGYRSLVRHFQDIDVNHKGFVTVEDIRTWRAQRRSARNGTHAADDTLHPRPAYEPGLSVEHRSFNTSTTQTVGRTPDARAGAASVPNAQ